MTNRLHFETYGNGYPLIMLHGWGWDSSIWQSLLPQLTDNYQLFLIDLPGFGKSPLLTKHYQIDEIASALLEIAPTNAVWLGWSLGGIIAWHIAIHFPERVSGLITVASSPKFVSTPQWPGVAPETLTKFSQLLIQNHHKTLLNFLELQLRGAAKNETLINKLQQQITTTSRDTVPALLGGLMLLQQLDLRAEMAKLSCRSLHLFGSNDTIVPASIANMIAPSLPFGQCKVIKRSGHMPFLSQADEFVIILNNFLRAVGVVA